MIVLVGWLIGCERPFIERVAPSIQVLSPDLSVVQTERTISVQVEASSDQRIDSVFMNGLKMEQLPGQNARFVGAINLGRGINQLRIQAFGSGNTEGVDTVSAVFLPGDAELADFRLPAPRGGHTATRLSNGDLLIAGGSALPTSEAYSDALVYESVTSSSRPQIVRMSTPRTEHTASRLPDQRVLIIGGSRVFAPSAVDELVETVEIYQPGFDTLRTVPVGGDPIRRSSHTTIIFPVRRDGGIDVFVYLFGGYGDIRYNPSPRMGIRSDLRVFEFRNDSLVAVGPTFGPFIEAVADHSVMSIQPTVGVNAQYLFGGAFFASETQFDSFAFESNFSLDTGIRILDTEPMRQPRTGHAAGRMVDGEILIFGGRTFSLTGGMTSVEVFHSRIDQFFALPDGFGMLQQRWGHTATNWDGSRILLVGGFGFAGAGLTTAEWFVVGGQPQSRTKK